MCAIYVDVETRIAWRLLDTRIGNTRHEAQSAQQRGRVLEVRGQIRSAHLHIDRGGRAEIEDLTDDVRRQEGEGDTRETYGEHLSELLNVFGRRTVHWIQRDLDVAVLRADRTGIVVRQIDPADG